MRNWLGVVREALRGWRQHDAPLLAAAIAFYAMWSLSPLLVVAVAVSALVFDPEHAANYLLRQIEQLGAPEAALIAEEVLRNTLRPANASLAAGVSLLLMLLGAARLFRQVKSALQIIWQSRPSQGGLQAILRSQLLSVLMVLVGLLALLLWLGVDVLLSALSVRWKPATLAWRWLSFAVGWGLLTVLFALSYRLLPDAGVKWRFAWWGAMVGGLLFALCKMGVGMYLGITGVQSAYGAASAAIAVLLWAYFSAQAFLFGAEWARAAQQQHSGGNHEGETGTERLPAGGG